MASKTDFAVAVLNGAIGNYLARNANGLATEMSCFRAGRRVRLDPPGFARAYPTCTPRIIVLVHGLMCTEAIWQFPDGSDYGSRLADELGYTPIYLRYNTGLAIADNASALVLLLERLVEIYPSPIQEILLLGYSMGGLVIRQACHLASLENRSFLPFVKRAIYVGTPHAGAPLERAGRLLTKVLSNVDDPYARLVGTIADLRSDGVKNLGDRAPNPLLAHIRHHLVAGSISQRTELDALLGDAVVSVASALDHGSTQSLDVGSARVRILRGVDHVALARHPEVHAQIRAWCEETC